MNEIGAFIKKCRKNKGLTQNELAEKLNISFQAVSKWENGETLPDTGILLELCDILEITVDTLLNGGVIINRTRKVISVKKIVDGFEHFNKIRDDFGENSPFYKAIIQGISEKMNFDFEDTLINNKEVLYIEAIINYLNNGYSVDIEEAKLYITKEKFINEILKRM